MVYINLYISASPLFLDVDLFSSVCDELLSVYPKSGVRIYAVVKDDDFQRMVLSYAKDRGYYVDLVYVNWNKYGNKAGMYHIERMQRKADTVLGFWDGKSFEIGYMKNNIRNYEMILVTNWQGGGRDAKVERLKEKGAMSYIERCRQELYERKKKESEEG